MKFNSTVVRAKHGFTMIELLVVIGIIGILAAVVLSQFSGATETARATQCMTNMRNLAVAAHNFALGNEDGNYPFAGSYKAVSFDNDEGYSSQKGWISYSKGGSVSKFSETQLENRLYSLTNGTLWELTGRSFATYQCPAHVRVCKDKRMDEPVWSYRMNRFFGSDKGSGEPVLWHGLSLQKKEWTWHEGNVEKRRVFNSDKVLMFAEIPVIDRQGVSAISLTASGTEGDSILQANSSYDNQGAKGESIGFNHKLGTRGYTGHVAFADGHVEKLLQPNVNNPSASAEQELTMWLCDGEDIAITGSKYERIKNDN